MNMIGNASCPYVGALEVIECSAQVLERFLAMIIGNERFAILGAEYQMHDDAR
jgi:hypothetical protein